MRRWRSRPRRQLAHGSLGGRSPAGPRSDQFRGRLRRPPGCGCDCGAGRCRQQSHLDGRDGHRRDVRCAADRGRSPVRQWGDDHFTGDDQTRGERDGRIDGAGHGATFTGAGRSLTASASEIRKKLAGVEFYSRGTTLLGTDTTAALFVHLVERRRGSYGLRAVAYARTPERMPVCARRRRRADRRQSGADGEPDGADHRRHLHRACNDQHGGDASIPRIR